MLIKNIQKLNGKFCQRSEEGKKTEKVRIRLQIRREKQGRNNQYARQFVKSEKRIDGLTVTISYAALVLVVLLGIAWYW